MRARLRTVAVSEAGLSVAACRARGLPEELLRLDDEALARCPSPSLRIAARALGRGLLRTGAQLYPSDEPLARYRASSAATPRPVAFGIVAGAGDMAPEEVAIVSLHEDAAGVLAAAVKLLPIDAGAAAAWLAALGEEIADLARLVVQAPEPASLSAPLIEIRSVKAIEGRLFAS
jgi:urease accessory protein